MRPSRLAAVVAASLLAACGSSKSSSTPPPPVDAPLPTATTVRSLAAYPLPRASGVDALDPLPGWADVLAVQGDLSVADFRFNLRGGFVRNVVDANAAASLFLGTPPVAATAATLPGTSVDTSLVSHVQAFADLAFTGPLTLVTEPGHVAASTTVAVAGGYTAPWALLAGSLALDGGVTTGTTLRQVIDLGGGVAGGATVVASWRQDGVVLGSFLAASPDGVWRVVLRTTGGAEVAVLRESVETVLPSGVQSEPVPASALTGLTQVVLSFEVTGATDVTLVQLDDVSLTVDGVEKVTNGGFAAGLTGWTAGAPQVPRRVVGAPRTVGLPSVPGTLQVTRSVYVAPDASWTRVTDLIHNPNTVGVSTTAIYEFPLGASTGAVISAVPGTAGKAFSAWDVDAAVQGTPDVAVVLGAGTGVFTSATALGSFDAQSSAFALHPIAVQAGQSVALVHFLVVGTSATAMAGVPTIGSRPAAVEATAKAIVDGFASTPTYRAYMSAAEQAAIANF